MAALERRHGRLQAVAGEVKQGGQHAAVDLPRPDVALAAAVDVDPAVREHAPHELLLAQQQELADRRVRGVGPEERVLALGAVDGGRLEQLPAVEDRLRVDPRRAAAGRPDLEAQVRHPSGPGPEPAEDGAADHARALAERLGREVARVEAERRPEGELVGGGRDVTEHGAGGRAVRMREQALLGERRRSGGVGRHLAVEVAGRPPLAAAPLAPLLRRRVAARDLAQVGVGVGVAVDVLHGHEAAEALAAAELDHAAVVDGDDRSLGAREDLDPAARLVGLDHQRRIALRGAIALVLELAGVGRLGVDREAALREPGERSDEVARQAADDLGAHQHRVDVPVGVVVGEHRLADVALGAGGVEVAGGGEDRVDGVERVLLAVAVGVDAVGGPGGGHELHPAERAGRRDVQVAAVVGLDLVDRGQDLPADAVLGAGGLVDREQEGRDPELVDEEVRDADPCRARLGEREGRVRRRRRAVRIGESGSGSESLLLGFVRIITRSRLVLLALDLKSRVKVQPCVHRRDPTSSCPGDAWAPSWSCRPGGWPG